VTAKPQGRGIRGWLPEVAIFIVVVGGIHLYRTADMLNASGEAAPALFLPTLDGGQAGLERGRPGLVYFFAPWCTWCAASAHNIRNLRTLRDERELSVFLVALSYQSIEEVQAYVDRHELEVTILLGTRQTAEQWGVSVFPTYYIVDDDLAVVHRDYGYSTLAGLWLRTWLAG
jgi:peroxiredoxin